MTLRDEFGEIIEDLRADLGDDLSNDEHDDLREALRTAVIAAVTTHAQADCVAALTELLLVTFYTGREHAKRGYTAPAGRSLDDLDDIPDTVEALLTPDLHRFHVEFHCDVTASNAQTAIAALHGDDWRVTPID